MPSNGYGMGIRQRNGSRFHAGPDPSLDLGRASFRVEFAGHPQHGAVEGLLDRTAEMEIVLEPGARRGFGARLRRSRAPNG